METLVDFAANYAVALAVERWPELLVGAAMLAFWRWLTWHKVRKQIADLKRQVEDREKTPPPPTEVHFHGEIGSVIVGSDGLYRAPARGEIVSPAPIEAPSPSQRVAGTGEATFAEPESVRIGLRLGSPDGGSDDDR